MAYYSIYPEKDATIYSHPDRKNLNTGHDEIVELVEEKSSVSEIYYPSRILVKFKNLDLKYAIEHKLKGKPVSASLQLFSCEHKHLAKSHTIETFPLSQSWDEGNQRWNSSPPEGGGNGVTWQYRTENTASYWATGSFGNGATGSLVKQVGGGVWYTGSGFRAENTFYNADDLDLDLDITDIVQKFSASFYQSATYPNGITNNGFIIKQTRPIEDDDYTYGELQYFSVDTHTVYPPKLTFKWDDSSYTPTVGATTLNTGSIFIALNNNKAMFQRKSVQRFRLTTRKRYPDRSFATNSNYLDLNYLPSTSYYSVRDAGTDEVIVPFDNAFTKLSADGGGMYFDLHMEGFQPERYYKLLIKVSNNDGVQVYDEDYTFKIVK